MQKHDLAIIIGAIPSYEDEVLLKMVNNSNVALISIMEDCFLMDKVDFFSRYEAGSEEGVIAILAKELLKDKQLPQNIKSFFENLDEGYISAETNIGEEEIEELHIMIKKSSLPLIFLGRDIFLNKRVQNIKRIISLLKKYSGIEILCFEDVFDSEETLEDIEELDSFDGTVVFNYKSDKNTDILSGSSQFAVAAKIKDGQNIVINIDNKKENRNFVLDDKLKGTIALMPMSDESLSYRCRLAKITKRET